MFAFAVTLMVFVASSCNKPSDPQLYSVSGFVKLQNGDALENATVLLYAHREIDTRISAIKEEYPNHGSELQMHDSFDHRTSIPIALVTSDQFGVFTFSSISAGSYNLAVYKEGFGFEYLSNLVVGASVSELQLMLAPEVILPSAITEDLVLEDNRVYRAPQNVTVLPSVNVTVGKDVMILVDPGMKIDIYGNLITPSDSSIEFLSADKIYSHSNQVTQVGKFDSVTLNNLNDSVVRNVKVKDTYQGLRFINVDNYLLDNLNITSDYQGISLVNSDEVVLRSCSVTGSLEAVRAAVYVENSENFTIESCILFDNKIGVQISGSTNSLVKNNYFISNEIYDFGYAEGGAGTVEYNTFRESSTAIYNFRGQMYANYNDIQAIIGIFSLRVDAWFSAKYNNLDCSQYGIKSQCMYYNSPIVTIDATRNYWFTTNLSEIEQKVWDRDNESTSSENYNLLVTQVNYQPISTTKQNAGVYN
jgi:parallel beta-helix repeat protein